MGQDRGGLFVDLASTVCDPEDYALLLDTHDRWYAQNGRNCGDQSMELPSLVWARAATCDEFACLPCWAAQRVDYLDG